MPWFTVSYPPPTAATDDLPELLRPAIEKHRDRADEEAGIPDDLLAALRLAGAFRLYTPRELGGFETSVAGGLSVMERLGRIDGAVAWIVWNLNLGCCAALLAETAVSQIWGNGADPLIANSGQPGRLVLARDGFRLSGRWNIVSGADMAEWAVLGAMVDDGTQFYFCCVPRSSMTVLRTWDVNGMRGSGSHTVVVKDLLLPAGMSFTLSTRPRIDRSLYRIPFTSVLFAGCAAVLIGMARSAVDEVGQLAHVKLMPDGTPLAAQPRLQAAVGRADAQVEAARLLLTTTAGRLDEAAAAGRPVTEAVRGAVRAAMCHVAETSREVLTAMYEVGGSTSLYNTSRLAHYELAGRTALGLPANVPFI